MSTRSLLRHIFRHSPRAKVGEDILPSRLQTSSPELASKCIDRSPKPIPGQKLCAMSSTLVPPPKTPEPFGLENIAEEDGTETPLSADTVSLTETLESLDLEISAFSTRELVHATLDEAKLATLAHLDTIDTTLALLDALDGFSATILELKKEMLEKKQAYEEKKGMLDAVERAIEGMFFAGESQELETNKNDAK